MNLQRIGLWLNQLSYSIDNLTLRERIYIVFAVVIVIWGGWDLLSYSDNVQHITKTQNELTRVQQQVQDSQMAMEQLMTAVQNNPNAKNKNQIVRLKQQYQKLKEDIELANLFTPPQMTQLLQNLLKQEKIVRVLRLFPLPAEIMFEVDESESALSGLPIIYKHGFMIEFDSVYFDTLQYFKKLESLGKHFYWDGVEYQVEDYPRAKVKIFIHTLSLQEDWVGS